MNAVNFQTSFISYIAYYFLISPLVKVLVVNLRYLFGGAKVEELTVRRVTSTFSVLDMLHALAPAFVLNPLVPQQITIEHFLGFGGEYIIAWDLTLYSGLLLATLILGLVGRFSVFYLHRDRYFHKFFTLYFVFQLAISLMLFSSQLGYLFMGWELLGLSSVLLIAFYEHRVQPLKNSLRILVIYKFGDFLLFSLVVSLLFYGGETLGDLGRLSLQGHPELLAALLAACFIKSGVFPPHWLPRAMEGPTPSSAIFYGALATHVPALVMIKAWPDALAITHWLSIAGIAVAAGSVLAGTALSRQANDAKNSLAYATIAQLSVIYIEILSGFKALALVHCLCHGVFRAFEFLRAPSLLYMHHTMESSKRHLVDKTGVHFEILLPERLRGVLYAWAIQGMGLLVRPFYFVDRFLSLDQMTVSPRSTLRFALGAIAAWIAVDAVLLVTFPFTVDPREETFLCLALCFALLAHRNLHRPRWFLLSAFLSVELTLSLLSAHIFDVLAVAHWGFLALFGLMLFAGGLRAEPASARSHAYRAPRKRSGWFTTVLFVAAFSIVAIPGLGNFFVWEFLVHHTAALLPALVMRSFVLIALNSLLVFLFVYANYLGESSRYKEVTSSKSDNIRSMPQRSTPALERGFSSAMSAG